MRAIRGALKPGGKLAKVCWRRKNESQFWAETEQVRLWRRDPLTSGE